MEKIELDDVKMWESLIQHSPNWLGKTICYSLKEQGLEYEDGHIVSIKEQDADFKIEKGKWYVCIRTSYKPNGKDFIEGKTYYAKEDYKIIGECGEVDIATDNPEEFFRPATEDEIEKQFKAGDVVVYVSRQPAYSGLYLLGNPNDLSIGYSNANEPYQIALRNCTVASEDERKQFMRELESNGYEWNENTLRIEKVEPVSEDLGEYINELSKQFQEVSFAKLSRIAVRVAKWQREQMMAKAIDGTARPDDNEIWCNLASFNLEDGDKVKVIVIKED